MAKLTDERIKFLRETYEEFDLKDLAVEFQKLQNRYNEAKDVSAGIYAEFEFLRKSIIPVRMEDMGLETAKISGVGRLQIGNQVSAKQLDKAALFKWLEANGHDSIIAESVNSSTLGSFIKEQIAQGEPIPDQDIVDFNVYEVASVVKA